MEKLTKDILKQYEDLTKNVELFWKALTLSEKIALMTAFQEMLKDPLHYK